MVSAGRPRTPELPIDDDYADVVFAFDSFDHWQDKAQGLAEVRRVLRQNGQFVVVKDGGVPGGAKARRAFVNDLAIAGFQAVTERRIKDGDVSFTMWICSVTD